MPLNQDKMKQLLQQGCPVFCFSSVESYLLQQAAAPLREQLRSQDADFTVFEEPAPDLAEMIAAAGTISFFGTRRLIEVPFLQPSAYHDADMKAFCDVLESTSNATFLLLVLQQEQYGRVKLSKNEKTLFALCEKLGYYEEVRKPGPAQMREALVQRARQQQTKLSSALAGALLERCGQDMLLLTNEVDKLCAVSGYTEITPEMVALSSTQTLEADVFDMIKLLMAHNLAGAMQKLEALLRLQNEPVAIAAALNANFVDLYRARLGAAKRRDYKAVFADFGYKGNSYRMKLTMDTARRYTTAQLEYCLSVLQQLDQDLKSKPVESGILLEAAVCQLASVGKRG